LLLFVRKVLPDILGEQILLKTRRVEREVIVVNVMNSNFCFEEKVGEQVEIYS